MEATTLGSVDLVVRGVARLRQPTLAATAYAAIRLALLKNQLRPGEVYSEVRLAQAVGMSRTPVREALRQLEFEGLIVTMPQKGFRLKPISEAELREFYELRELLEVYVGETLAGKITEQQLHALDQLWERQRRAVEDGIAFISIDEEFHLTLGEMAELARTARMISSLRGILWLLGNRMTNQPQRRTAVLTEHKQIIDSLRRRDIGEVVRAIRAHIRETAQEAMVHLASDSDGELGPVETSASPVTIPAV